MFIYNVLIAHNIISSLKYSSSQELNVGTLVSINIRGKTFTGIIESIASDNNNKIKPIQEASEIILSDKLISFLLMAAKYNISTSGSFVKMAISNMSFKKKKTSLQKNKISTEELKEVILNNEQQYIKNNIILDGNSTNLIFGVTGSGKTELCISIIQDIIKQNKQVLILVPEIGITYQWKQRLDKYCKGIELIIWHSQATSKNNNFQKIISGEAKIIIAARSGIFLPYKNLGLLIIDEEHDSSYKQENFPLYNGRDMAVLRAKTENIPSLLLSATPSLESYNNCLMKKFQLYKIKKRFNDFSLPRITVERKQIQEVITEKFLRELKENFIKKEQSIVYINKRGYSHYASCERCQITMTCQSCSFCLVPHKLLNKLVCHYCGGKYPLYCLLCKKTDFILNHGYGVEKMRDYIQELFPEARVMIFSSDYCDNPKKIEEAMRKIENHEVDIIVGTQMISKGYDIKKLTLVGIADADFHSLDFRSKEHLYQSVIQVSGRAGRHLKGARVVVQTSNEFFPEFCYDYELFLKSELNTRKLWNLPPFKKIIKFQFEEKSQIKAQQNALEFFHQLVQLGLNPEMPFAGKKISNMFQWKFYLKKNKSFFNEEENKIASIAKEYGTKIYIDVDPISL